MKGISVVINTYNASEHLAEVLESVRGFDEIVVCDMESTDDTREIAARYGCKVVIFPKGNYNIAEPARNFAISSAENEWVLVVDADELIPDALREYAYDFLEKHGDEYVGLKIPRKNYMLHHFMRSSYPDYQLRLFKKGGSNWPPTVHATIQLEGDVAKIPSSREDLAMVHISSSAEAMFRRMNQYSGSELVRRKEMHVTFAKLVFSPAFRFIKTYFFKGGIRYGRLGFIHAYKNAMYKFMVLTKFYEKEQNEKFWNEHGHHENK